MFLLGRHESVSRRMGKSGHERASSGYFRVALKPSLDGDGPFSCALAVPWFRETRNHPNPYQHRDSKCYDWS